MYLLCLETKDRNHKAIIKNIVRSPYWNEPKYDSLEILQFSLNSFFVNYLKYPGIEHK